MAKSKEYHIFHFYNDNIPDGTVKIDFSNEKGLFAQMKESGLKFDAEIIFIDQNGDFIGSSKGKNKLNPIKCTVDFSSKPPK